MGTCTYLMSSCALCWVHLQAIAKCNKLTWLQLSVLDDAHQQVPKLSLS